MQVELRARSVAVVLYQRPARLRERPPRSSYRNTVLEGGGLVAPAVYSRPFSALSQLRPAKNAISLSRGNGAGRPAGRYAPGRRAARLPAGHARLLLGESAARRRRRMRAWASRGRLDLAIRTTSPRVADGLGECGPRCCARPPLGLCAVTPHAARGLALPWPGLRWRLHLSPASRGWRVCAPLSRRRSPSTAD